MIRILLIVIGVLGLIGVRVFEDQLFYDPFLAYFKGDGENELFPSFEWGRLILSYMFRFSLNLFFSAWIIGFLFRDFSWVKNAVLLMLIVFIIVFPIYLYCIYDRFGVGYLFSFYLRRFVIQPLTVLILIPVIYYVKKNKINNG